MFERFTDKARTVVILAKARAAERGDQIRPVYMLHALAAGDGVAARALAGPQGRRELRARRARAGAADASGAAQLDRAVGADPGGEAVAGPRPAGGPGAAPRLHRHRAPAARPA